MTLRRDQYRPGDALRIRTSEPLLDLDEWETGMPPGDTYIARGADGRPVALLGVWPDGDIYRVWARIADHLGSGSWAWLFREARTIIRRYDPVILECHVRDQSSMKWVKRFGFKPVRDDNVYPLKMRRCR